MSLASSELADFQKVQYTHDLRYHPDIVALGTIGRLKHMALHNAKYAARFAESAQHEDPALFSKTLTDAFIICLSTANTLTQNLSVELAGGSDRNQNNGHNADFNFAYLSVVGRMAKACESIDHLEDYPFRPEIGSANVSLMSLLIDEAGSKGIELREAFSARLETVEKNSGFALFAGRD